MIQLKNVSKKLSGKAIIRALSCQCRRGVLHISGENGSGKSTLLAMMAGALRPDEGQILYSEIDLYKKNGVQVKQKLGYCPSQTPIYDFLTGAEFLKFICQIKNAQWPSELIDLLRLRPDLGTFFHAMSYGTKKKFFFIAAILTKPQYLLLDEPMNGIDQKSSNEIFNILTKHLETEDGLCVLVTHDERWIHEWRDQFSYQNVNLSN